MENYYYHLNSLKKKIKDNVRLKIKKLNFKGNLLEVLRNKKVVGVDGSQILPLKELGIPLGLIQVAKISILHGAGKYDLRYYSAFASIEENIDLKRFKLEIETLTEECKNGGWLFYDGPLYPAFIVELNKKLKEEYLTTVNKLLSESKKHCAPVIGYIDKSFSRDLSRKFGFEKIYDIHLLFDMKMFSYTEPFETERKDIMFCYAKLNPGHPVRIEFPAWIAEDYDELIKIVMAECMLSVTKGYPYILERAHKYALIKSRERLALIEALNFGEPSFKWISKLELVK